MAGARQAELQLSICTGPTFEQDILDLEVFVKCRDQWDFSATVLGQEKAATDESPERALASWEVELCPVGQPRWSALHRAQLPCFTRTSDKSSVPSSFRFWEYKRKAKFDKARLFPSESAGLA